jgi:hypothetical protein
MEIDEIRARMSIGEYRFSDHAVKRMIRRSISRTEVEEAVLSGDIIEEYPDDKYAPSCLVFGVSKAGKRLHVQLSSPPAVTVITVYEPDEAEWMDYRVRRTKT